MARAPFDTTCDLYIGDGTGTPGALYASGPCRLVPEAAQTILTAVLAGRGAYLTLDFTIPNGPQVTALGGHFDFDFRFSDWVAVPSGAAIAWSVLFVEEVVYLGHPVYYRAHLGPAF